jgi:hypothetical protein
MPGLDARPSAADETPSNRHHVDVSTDCTPPQQGLVLVPRRGQASAMQKLGAHSRAEAVQVAEAKGWL